MQDEDKLPNPLPAGWLEAIARGEADLAAGRVVPGEAVHARLRRTIGEMEAPERVKAGRGGAALKP